MKKGFILTAICIVLFATTDIKADVYIELFGDEIVFDQASTGVSANNNVTMLYQDYIITTNAFKYSKAQKVIRFPDYFEINKSDKAQHISGSYFNYDLHI
jgi:hypothetical protein